MQNWLPHLLHLSDPALPVGAYTHSNGLETYVQQGLVKDAATAGTYIRNMLEYNFIYNDGFFAWQGYMAAAADDVELLLSLDEECNALKSPMEMRQASQKLGLRLLKLMTPLTKHAFAKEYASKTTGHYCLVFGVYAYLLGIPLEEAMTAYYYNAATGMVTNCVKLVPLGQQQGQEILYSLLPLLSDWVAKTQMVPRELAGRCSPAFDISCMQHEKLYSRLYMS
ncbi:urease accessory protein UreF [Chitinophaga sancti]|uniref:urease accessory protein UreF n=1 Tax=Chitinophaga sancti TaxID=1004 RepID=UPI002A750985|nr:urease accessory protein UreF [Chitinophaga sancti]WPQ64921.1 urease accessory protein UreF [Chitinophaga sancti]